MATRLALLDAEILPKVSALWRQMRFLNQVFNKDLSIH